MSKVADTFAGGQDRGCPQDSSHSRNNYLKATESFLSSSSSSEQRRQPFTFLPYDSDHSDFGSDPGNGQYSSEIREEEEEEDSNASGELISMSVVIYSLK